MSKCSFVQTQIEYLGHMVSSQGVASVPMKILAIRQWPTPHSAQTLRSFLGLAGFYRRFIWGYASIAAPLTRLLGQDPFEWSPEADRAFLDLRQVLTNAPVLQLPDFELSFTVETNSSGVDVVLSQKRYPLAFFSKPFPPKLLRASTYVHKLFAITTTMKKWHQYLLGHRFTIITDHRSLRELIMQVIQTPEQQTYLAKLMGYNYSIQCRSSKLNTTVDALSRLPETMDGSLLLLLISSLTFLSELKSH